MPLFWVFSGGVIIILLIVMGVMYSSMKMTILSGVADNFCVKMKWFW